VIDGMDEVRKMYERIYLNSLKKENAKEPLPVSLIARGIRGIAGYAVALADDAVLAVFG
jgi:hypothetical protein